MEHQLLPYQDPDQDPDLDLDPDQDQDLDQDPDLDPDLDPDPDPDQYQDLDPDLVQDQDPDQDPDLDQDLSLFRFVLILLHHTERLDALNCHIPIVGQRLIVLPLLLVERTSLIDDTRIFQLNTRGIHTDQTASVDVDTTE